MIEPFSDDQQSSSIADLTIENGTAAVVISGTLEVTRDKVGLRRAQELKLLADALVERLRAGDLPDEIERPRRDGGHVPNPFA